MGKDLEVPKKKVSPVADVAAILSFIAALSVVIGLLLGNLTDDVKNLIMFMFLVSVVAGMIGIASKKFKALSLAGLALILMIIIFRLPIWQAM